MPEQTLYDVLGVPPDATPAEIEAAHRRQLKYWHPDRNNRADADRRAKSINHAYDVLSDPAQRADYDQHLAAGTPLPDTSADAGPPPWTPPPGRYRRRSSRSGTWGSSRAGPGPTSAGAPPPPPPPPPPAAGVDWGYWAHDSRVKFLWRQSRAAIVWLVEPLRQPARTHGFSTAIVARVVALAATAGVLWLVTPLLLAAVRFVVGLFVLAAMLALFALATGSAGFRRRRRRR